MFEDYKKLILSAYRKKVEQQLLPISLVLPSPAKLRDECWKVCENRFQPKDLNTLRDFFGGVNGKEDCLRVIKRFELDKFKPLINYLIYLHSLNHQQLFLILIHCKIHYK